MAGTVSILGVPFSKLTLNETTLHLTKHIQSGEPKLFHLITANPEITITSQSDELLRTILHEADLITPDGIGIVLASRRKGDPIAERVTGYELLLELLAQGNKLGWSFYFLGTDEHTSCKAVEKITELYPNVKIAGRHNGFLAKEEEPAIVAEIQHAQPDFLIVAMGLHTLTSGFISINRSFLRLRLCLAWGKLGCYSGKSDSSPCDMEEIQFGVAASTLIRTCGQRTKVALA